MVPPFDAVVHHWLPQKQYPVEIQPRTSQTFYLSEAVAFPNTLKGMLSEIVLSAVRGRFLSAYVLSDDGLKFSVKFDSIFRQNLKSARSLISKAPVGMA